MASYLGADVVTTDYASIAKKQLEGLSKEQQVQKLIGAMKMLNNQLAITISNGATNFTKNQQATMEDMKNRVAAMYSFITSGQAISTVPGVSQSSIDTIVSLDTDFNSKWNTISSWSTVEKAASGWDTTFKVGGYKPGDSYLVSSTSSPISSITKSTAGKVAIIGAVAVGAFLLYKKFM